VLGGIATSAHAQNFSIQNGKFIDPDGKEFIPIGANVNPWNYFDWQQNIWSEEHQDIWTDCWRFNFMRAPVFMNDLNWHNGIEQSYMPGWATAPDQGLQKLKELVDIYTAKKVVVMINAHDFICRWPTDDEMVVVREYFKTVANEFKDNPYVWFNLFNEPGFDSPVPDTYRTIHQDIIKIIRDEVGAQNMIVATGSQCGMEARSWDNEPIWGPNSAFLTYGDDLINFNGKTYQNIAFDLHMYDQWAFDMQILDAKLRDFLTRVKARGYAVLIGEVGSPPASGSHNSDKYSSHARATELAYKVALKEYGIGMVHWHWDPEDGFALVDGPHKFNGGTNINDCENPTNLTSWGGAYFWKATHEDGFGLDGGGGTVITPPPSGGDGNIVVRARMALGSSDQLQLKINDNTVHTWTISGSSFQNYSHSLNYNGGNIKLNFVDNGTDLEVDYLSVDGVKYEAESQAVNTSVWQGTCGGSYSQYMHCPGYIDFGGGTSSGGGQDDVIVRARGVVGDEQISLLVNDQSVASWTVSSAMDEYTYQGAVAGKNVKVAYTNDAGARDAIIDYLSVNGQVTQAETQAVNTGIWQNGSCGGSYSEWMNCNGYIDFGSPSARTVANSFAKLPGTSGAPSLDFNVYPNPSSGQVQVQVPEKMTLQIYNSLGQLSFQQAIPPGYTMLNLNSLNPGTYVVRAYSAGKYQVKRLLIE
jgi:mannan endo-1,4-beta-mannosidase